MNFFLIINETVKASMREGKIFKVYKRRKITRK